MSLDDDVLDLDAVDETRLTGEAALLASLRHGRTGRMGDIVATIQADQDRIIREDRHGILVVEGGPGTGKTVVALHRAAYLQTPATSRAGLTPQRLLAQLYAEPGRLDLTDDERAAVARRTQAPWTPADVPLLDELAELRGPLDATTRTASRRRAADEAERAQTRKYTAQLVKQLAEEQAKGLEFDSVIIVDPAGIERASSRGRADLYVALTRTTRRLGLVLSDDWQAPGTPAAHR